MGAKWIKPTGVAVLMPSGAGAAAGAERRLWDAVAGVLEEHGVVSVVVEPPAEEDLTSCRADGIVARQKAILAAWDMVHATYRGLPAVVLAAGDSALCALALLKADRVTTRALRACLVVGVSEAVASFADVTASVVFLADRTDYAAQVSAAAGALLGLLAEAYAARVMRVMHTPGYAWTESRTRSLG